MVKAGKLVGTSGPSISTGLKVLGGYVGGGMISGLVLSTLIPLASAGTAWGIVKGVKWYHHRK